MKKKVTVALDEKTIALTRTQAANRNLSLSSFVNEALRAYLDRENAYEASMKRFLAKKPFPLSGPPERYPTREELYDRPVLRRK